MVLAIGMPSMGLCVMLWLTFFFFNDTATTEIYTLSLHDALPIYTCSRWRIVVPVIENSNAASSTGCVPWLDRKSTRLNSSHLGISYAVFCLKKKTLDLEFFRVALLAVVLARLEFHPRLTPMSPGF